MHGRREEHTTSPREMLRWVRAEASRRHLLTGLSPSKPDISMKLVPIHHCWSLQEAYGTQWHVVCWAFNSALHLHISGLLLLHSKKWGWKTGRGGRSLHCSESREELGELFLVSIYCLFNYKMRHLTFFFRQATTIYIQYFCLLDPIHPEETEI